MHRALNQLYPVYFQLRDRLVVVIGGGRVATRRIPALLEAGAHVRVVSPLLTETLAERHGDGELEWLARPYRPGDLTDAAIVLVAVDDSVVDEQVARDAKAARIPVNVASDGSRGDFHVPATGTIEDLQVAVGTRGKNPSLAAKIRDRVLAWLRREPAGSLSESRSQHPVRGHRADRTVETPRVALVGAGPGSADLLTLRAFELLEAADVVYYDRLVGEGVLDVIPPHVEQIYVGKEVGCARRASVTGLMIDAARQGRRVVRLKGGDPFLFGRGGEEMVDLSQAGVPFEVIPGVSALCSVPGSVGIPVTSRGVADELVVRSGHAMQGSESGSLRLGGRTTYVYFMAIGRIAAVVHELLEEGVSRDTPVAVVARGTQPEEEVVEGTLKNIVERIRQTDVEPPALVIVGDVVRFRDLATAAQLFESAQDASVESVPEHRSSESIEPIDAFRQPPDRERNGSANHGQT